MNGEEQIDELEGRLMRLNRMDEAIQKLSTLILKEKQIARQELDSMTETPQDINKAKIKEIIDELEQAVGKNIPLEDIMRKSKEQGLETEETGEIIRQLLKEGHIFSPRHEIICKT